MNKNSKEFYILIASVVFLVVGVFLYGFLGKNEIKKPISGENVIAFGDSLIFGYGSTDGGDLVSELSRRIQRPIINAGKNGDTTISALARLEEDVLEKEPKIVIVLLGGNDAIRKISKETIFSNLTLIIDNIQNKGAAIVLVGIRSGLFDNYDDDFKKLAKEKGVVYVPRIMKGILGNRELMFDSIHPNNEGYSKMADKIEPALIMLLE